MSIAPALSTILLALILPGDDTPLPAEAAKAIESSRAKLIKARAAYLAEVRAETAALIAALKKEQDAATKAGNLDGALAIRERIERLRAGETLEHTLVGTEDLIDRGAVPTKASIARFAWTGNDEDRVGAGRPIAADGRKDERFALSLSLPADTKILSVRILADDNHGHWVTPEEPGRWPVAVLHKGAALADGVADGLGRFSGHTALDLFIAPDADYRPTSEFEVKVTVRSSRGRDEELRATCKRSSDSPPVTRPTN